MLQAKEQNGQIISAKAFDDKHHTQLICSGESCGAELTFVKSHTVKYSDTSVSTAPFFKLQTKQKHRSSCPFNIKNQIATLCEEAHGKHLMHLDGDQYMFSLLAFENQNEDKELVKLRQKIKHEQREKKTRSFLKLLAQVLLLRHNVVNNKALLSTLLLDYTEKRIRWDKFYFDVKSYGSVIELFKNKAEYPIALHGIVKSVESEEDNCTITLHGAYNGDEAADIIVQMNQDAYNSDVQNDTSVIVYGKPVVDKNDATIKFDISFKEQIVVVN
jgi:hypothetical protein